MINTMTIVAITATLVIVVVVFRIRKKEQLNAKIIFKMIFVPTFLSLYATIYSLMYVADFEHQNIVREVSCTIATTTWFVSALLMMIEKNYGRRTTLLMTCFFVYFCSMTTCLFTLF